MDYDVYRTFMQRVKLANTNVSQYLKVLVDSFAGLSAAEYQKMVEDRAALREDIARGLSEVAAMELLKENLKWDLNGESPSDGVKK